MLYTLRGKLKKGKVLSIGPNLSFKVINWVEVHFLAGKRGYFLVEPYMIKEKMIGIIVLKYILIDK